MIFPSNRVRIMVATKPVDFRKGHDGLAALVKNELHRDPFTGTVFVFRSRKADGLKLIYWVGSGLVMAYKRLEEHTFTWPGIKDGLMTLGPDLLRSGASFAEISQLLRHRSIDSTRIYAKLDVEKLRELSLPWPGGVQ
ncbi:IS66 family insertion sequence element accessory protein TnpB [Brucella cytisi]|uniref:IS66 family insertion sequence element accessory protein TnpB n=1 Tax=Brucella cytisi TaxID=407152 RepID=UPI0035D63EAF